MERLGQYHLRYLDNFFIHRFSRFGLSCFPSTSFSFLLDLPRGLKLTYTLVVCYYHIVVLSRIPPGVSCMYLNGYIEPTQ